MNKRIIWLIIGVMSIAVIGVVSLQSSLVLKSIKANEDTFDKNVQNALSEVAERLEQASLNDDYLLYVNGYSVEYLDANGAIDSNNGAVSIPLEQMSRLEIEKSGLSKGANMHLCVECNKRKRKELGLDSFENITYDFAHLHDPIEERIKPAYLIDILEQEMKNNAIKTGYEFGVYSHVDEAIVIHNGQPFAAHLMDEGLSLSQDLIELINTKYEVTLFEDEEGNPQGLLKVRFPNKNRVLWSAMLPSFIGTFLFAILILACFGYTVWVVFRQKRISEMKTDFINNMTHEFKTPIATISLAADSIANPKISGDSNKVLRFINIIKQENRRMNNQVEKVLQMAKIDRMESKMRVMAIDLHEIIERAVENIGLQVEPRGGTAKAVLKAEQPTIVADLTHVSNVINNLLDNANKYSPSQPQISVSTANVKGGVEVTVSDQGMGMNKEARKHIFDKFYRVHTGDVHDVKGFGLGLSYVKAIMDAHGGTVDVKSELGKGSDFILFFPHGQDAQHIDDY